MARGGTEPGLAEIRLADGRGRVARTTPLRAGSPPCADRSRAEPRVPGGWPDRTDRGARERRAPRGRGPGRPSPECRATGRAVPDRLLRTDEQFSKRRRG